MEDILLAGKDDGRIAAVKQAFSQELVMGELHYFLGMKGMFGLVKSHT